MSKQNRWKPPSSQSWQSRHQSQTYSINEVCVERCRPWVWVPLLPFADFRLTILPPQSDAGSFWLKAEAQHGTCQDALNRSDIWWVMVVLATFRTVVSLPHFGVRSWGDHFLLLGFQKASRSSAPGYLLEQSPFPFSSCIIAPKSVTYFKLHFKIWNIQTFIIETK